MRTRPIAMLILATVLVLAIPALAAAADQPSIAEKNEISIDLALPVGMLFLLPDSYVIPIILDYQRVLADNFVLSVVPGFFYIHASGSSTPESVGAELWVELDWHPSSSGLKGFFVGPAATAVWLTNLGSSTLAAQLAGVMVGATVGYQLQIFSNMNLDFALGLVAGPKWQTGYDVELFPFARASVALGYRF